MAIELDVSPVPTWISIIIMTMINLRQQALLNSALFLRWGIQVRMSARREIQDLRRPVKDISDR